VEGIYLDCGARRPQLKRVPLGRMRPDMDDPMEGAIRKVGLELDAVLRRMDAQLPAGVVGEDIVRQFMQESSERPRQLDPDLVRIVGEVFAEHSLGPNDPEFMPKLMAKFKSLTGDRPSSGPAASA
jgi:hypothetical protein